MAKQNMEDNILSYANEIQTLETFVEAVRQAPGQFIGPRGNRGYLNMVREIFQNSMDELIKIISPCDTIWVAYDEITKTFISEDNGRGIPFDNIIRIFSSQYTSSNYKKKEGEFSSGRHGVGSKVVNALSSEFIVESYMNIKGLVEGRRVIFNDFIPQGEEQALPNKEKKQGSKVSFIPCFDVMGKITVTVEEVLLFIKSLFPLSPIGSVMYFRGIHEDGTVYEEQIINKDGIMTYLILQTTSPIVAPIVVTKHTGRMKIDTVFTYDSNDLQAEQIISFSNFCPTVAGTHVDGFIEGVCRFFRDYMNKIYLANSKSKKLVIINNDIKTGLKAAVTVSHLEPDFTGQAKEILSNPDMFDFVKFATMESLDEWSKKNTNDLQKICKYLKDVAEIRLKSEEGKIKLTNKYQASSLTGLPAKLILASGKENLEYVIVEGDSAAGSAKGTRCKQRQTIMPIRGKIPNCFTTTKVKFLDNEEISGMIVSMGAGYGKSCDPKATKYEKFILMPDADPDGAHIRSLLLKFFLMYLLPLVKAGKLYAAVPPLFGIPVGKDKKGKTKMKYFVDRYAITEYIQNMFTKNNEVRTLRGNMIDQKELISICMKNEDYTYELNQIADRYAINPIMLETVLMNKDKSINHLKQELQNRFRFIDIDKRGNTNIITGLGDSKFHTVFLNDQFYADVLPLYDKFIKNNPSLYFNLNNTPTSLYSFMSLFESTAPNNLIRYKGLGEMNPDQLAESTLHPDSPHRTLIQYTIESVEKEIETITHLENNKYELIKDVKVNRIDLIG